MSNKRAWKKLCRSPIAMLSLAVVLLYLAAAVGTELYAVYCDHCRITPIYQIADDNARYAPPPLSTGWEPIIRDGTSSGVPSPAAQPPSKSESSPV